MGVIKDRHGTYYAQQRVPARLQEAVARVLNNGKPKQTFLKRSLGTKDLRAANVAAKPVLAQFDRTLADAEALLKERPVIASITDAQIRRMSESYYAAMLANDEEERGEGTGSEEVFQSIAQQLSAEGIEYRTPFAVGEMPEAGLSDREIYKRKDTLDFQLAILPNALARGDITVFREELDELLNTFQLNLDRNSASYRRLGRAVLAAHVRALKDIERRNSGEPVETPTFTYGNPGGVEAANAGGTLRDALSGWSKHRVRPAGTVHEYTRTIEMFIQQHGDLAVSAIRKSHAREFVQAAQLVPRARSGQLRNATLPALNEWVQKHPEAPRVSVATVNKQIGAMQAITGWAHHHGIIPEEMPWLDPFSNMKIEEERSERGPFDARELQQIFDAPLFTSMEQPQASQGAAGVWLPLLALFSGARRAELAGLRADNVRTDEETGTALISIVAERRAGKRVKTRSSERVVPVHRELIKLGFLEYVAGRRIDGEQAWLFAKVAPDQPNAIAVWGKWFSRYLRSTVGISNPNRVFHSFRHKFSDGATRAGVSRELRQALMGHSDGSVSAGYGSEAMLERFGAKALADAVSKISYPGLDLSRVKPRSTPTSSGRTKIK